MADMVPLDITGADAPPLLLFRLSLPGSFCRPALSAVLVVEVCSEVWNNLWSIQAADEPDVCETFMHSLRK
ncbi:MAG TPA: hypothetical protein PLN33_01245 [Hyphomonadaceae bacterium]|nr:hypothetical protein [Hyphomonadaceae bacterium]HPN05467.1 hypothetical protein [Hyphomonadaceae bacterium]